MSGMALTLPHPRVRRRGAVEPSIRIGVFRPLYRVSGVFTPLYRVSVFLCLYIEAVVSLRGREIRPGSPGRWSHRPRAGHPDAVLRENLRLAAGRHRDDREVVRRGEDHAQAHLETPLAAPQRVYCGVSQ